MSREVEPARMITDPAGIGLSRATVIMAPRGAPPTYLSVRIEPDIGRITLLIRRNRNTSAARRFEKIVAESPTLDGLQEQYGARLGGFLREKIDVVVSDLHLPPHLDDISEVGRGIAVAIRGRRVLTGFRGIATKG